MNMVGWVIVPVECNGEESLLGISGCCWALSWVLGIQNNADPSCVVWKEAANSHETVDTGQMSPMSCILGLRYLPESVNLNLRCRYNTMRQKFTPATGLLRLVCLIMMQAEE